MIRHPLFTVAVLAALLLPDAAWAGETIVFDKGTIAFFVLIGIVTGTVGWWRANSGDGVVTTTVWCIILITGLAMLRFSPATLFGFVFG